jgi:hypothetical protein
MRGFDSATRHSLAATLAKLGYGTDIVSQVAGT